MKGDKELECLNSIKQEIFTKDGEPIIHTNYFGLLEKDRNEIEQILRIAKSNEKTSEFPDFTFDNGFIEHFQVTSSKTTSKGSEHIKKTNCFDSKVKEETEIFKQNCNDNHSFDEGNSKHWTMDNTEHSHLLLLDSFKANWEKHIISLNKYTGRKDVGLFLIELSDYALCMKEDVYNDKDWKDGMSQGDMRKCEEFNCYRLTRDKILLDFIYEYKEKIRYVIFRYYDGFEIIMSENIPHLLKIIPWEFKICPLTVLQLASIYNMKYKK